MNGAPLTQIDLDLIVAGGCTNPRCKEKHPKSDSFFLSPVCHHAGATFAEYKKGGVLSISCAVCRKLIANIRVAQY